MYIETSISNIKGISALKIKLPLQPGIYAVCGANASGKSTLFACISAIFNKSFVEFLEGAISQESEMSLKYLTDEVVYKRINGNFSKVDKTKFIPIDGFHEGSIIYGTRFTDAVKTSKKQAKLIKDEHLVPADNFVIKNLSYILHNNYDNYQQLYRIANVAVSHFNYLFDGNPYFIKIPNGYINQFDFSTGEYLLTNLLHLVNNLVLRNFRRRNPQRTFAIFVDEVELALHPSAIKRLLEVLQEICKEYNIAVYFATHSIEIIHSLRATNIFYLEKQTDQIVTVLNPCSPAYATRYIYKPDSLDFLILVEDEFAKRLISKVITDNRLYENILYWIVPGGSWDKTLKLHLEFSRLPSFHDKTAIVSILDGDIHADYTKAYQNDTLIQSLTKMFLPIPSVEKYLYQKIITENDVAFINDFGGRFFLTRSFRDVVDDYKRNYTDKRNGKNLMDIIIKNFNDIGVTKEIASERMVSYIIENIDTSKFVESLRKVLT